MPEFEIYLDQVNSPPEALRGDSSMVGVGRRRGVVVDNLDMRQKRVGITTLGCKVNTYESEIIASSLRTSNWLLVNDSEVADLYLINTCTVTREADRQARQAVRRVIKINPEALVIVTGCYAQIDAQSCAEIPGVDLVLGNDQKLDVHKLLPALQRGSLPKVLVGDLDQQVSLPEHILAGYESYSRAFVQIQQGCDQGCTFCIIHVARGPSRSLSLSLIKRQVQRLALNGYAEIVICGVDLGSYGQDFEHKEINLVALLKELLAIEVDCDNPFRLRLSSLDPHHITDDLINLFADEPRLCPQIHLSLQSGNTLILKRMKRRYTAEHVRERISELRKVVPNLVLSADVMVGFPTETEDQYQDTEDLVRELDIAYPHVFSYSARDGTPAARIPTAKQVPIEHRKARNKQLRKVGEELEAALLKRKLGTQEWVLPEKNARHSEYIQCRGEDYVPVTVPLDSVELGCWQKININRLQDGVLFGEPF